MKIYELNIGTKEQEALRESVKLAMDVLKMDNEKIKEALKLNDTGLGLLDQIKSKIFGMEVNFNKEIEKKYQILNILNSKLS